MANAKCTNDRATNAREVKVRRLTFRGMRDTIAQVLGLVPRPVQEPKRPGPPSPRPQDEARADELKRHVKACPIGWHNGQIKLHRATTDAEVIAWIRELERLVGEQDAFSAAKTRLPRPYAYAGDE